MQPGQFLPDVAIIRHTAPEELIAQQATAVLSETETIDAPFHIQTLSMEMRELFIEIVAVRQEGKVVTGIELLSPSNKENGRGGEEYLRKQWDMLRSDAHFLEIDLLRGGTHTVGTDKASIAVVAGLWSYIICLHRAGMGNNFDVWTRQVTQRLPRIAVPLTEGYADIALDVQEAVDRTYERGAFGRAIDYRHAPVPDLPDYYKDWNDRLLRDAGLRQ